MNARPISAPSASLRSLSQPSPRLPSLAAPRRQAAPLAPFRALLLRLLAVFSASSRAGDRALAVEERVAVGPKKSLLVVRCHGRRYLVASAGDTLGPFLEIAAPRARRSPQDSRKESRP